MIKSRKGQEGFTLIELLVVVLIIGILAAIAIPAFLGQKKGAQDSNAKSLLRNGAIAMESYYSEYQDFSYTTHGVPAGTVATEMVKIEPNMKWSAGNVWTGIDAKDDEIAVEVTNGATAGVTSDAYNLRTSSASGRQFAYVRGEDASVKKCNDGTVACATNQW